MLQQEGTPRYLSESKSMLESHWLCFCPSSRAEEAEKSQFSPDSLYETTSTVIPSATQPYDIGLSREPLREPFDICVMRPIRSPGRLRTELCQMVCEYPQQAARSDIPSNPRNSMLPKRGGLADAPFVRLPLRFFVHADGRQ